MLRLEACGTRHGIAFADKFANAVAQLGQRLVLRGGDLFCHAVSISYYDIYERLQARRWFLQVITMQILRDLQRLAEGLLRLVMLVAGTFVKLVGALADHIRTDGHALAVVFAGPILGGGEQPRACAETAMPFRDN